VAFGLQVMAYLQYRIINMRFPNNDIHIFQIKKSKLKIEKVLLFVCIARATCVVTFFGGKESNQRKPPKFTRLEFRWWYY